ncbi:hypothetical protein [Pseudomonas viridiflava]|uniref:hypothetical protein n=1 Tax=Pseudomonas viridiflava TaxID=33069 RepID=UPI000F012560|nr:hypothetical protein [Pseudomonas viridiflava]
MSERGRPHHVFDVTLSRGKLSGRPHHVFDVTLSRIKHRTVGGGLPAMNDDAIFLTYRVDCIAGKPPPTVWCIQRSTNA